jgi:hypothetical protein
LRGSVEPLDVSLVDSELSLPFPHAGSERATTAAINSTTSRATVKMTGAQGVLHRFALALRVLCASSTARVRR